jgi:putative flippase GtrA
VDKRAFPSSERQSAGEPAAGDGDSTGGAAGTAHAGRSARLWTGLHRHTWVRTLQARRFVVVGVVNTSVDYVLFVGLTKILHLPLDWVWVAKLMSGTVAISISFLLNRSWVFGATSHRAMRQAAKFVAATAVGVYAIQTPFTQLFASVFQAPGRALYDVLRDVGLTDAFPSLLTQALATKTAAFALATCFSMTFNFLAYRYWVFRDGDSVEPRA